MCQYSKSDKRCSKFGSCNTCAHPQRNKGNNSYQSLDSGKILEKNVPQFDCTMFYLKSRS